METLNIVSTVAKAVSPKPTSVPVSNNALSNIAEVGKALPQEAPKAEVSQSQQIEETVSDLNKFVQSIQRGIQFSVHEETGRSIITVTDRETGEEIRKFPSEEALAIADFIAETKAQLNDVSKGIVFNQSA
jgi:flagellar protein FlaG